MTAGDIGKLLSDLGCVKIRNGGTGWVYSSCPFATWKHPGGVDLHPSFEVSVHADRQSGFSCFGCGEHGNLKALVERIRLRSGRDLSQSLAFVVTVEGKLATAHALDNIQKVKPQRDRPIEVAGVVVGGQTALKLEQSGTALDVTVQESVLASFSELPGFVRRYLTDERMAPDMVLDGEENPRGLSECTIQDWELCYDPLKRKLIIPIRDLNGRLVGYSRRSLGRTDDSKYMHSKGFRRDWYLYGEHKVQKATTGILVEGFFDVMALHQRAYRTAVGMLGSYLSEIQIKKLTAFFDRLIYIPDGDEPGLKAAERVKKDLYGRLRHVSVVEMPSGYDPDDLTNKALARLIGPPEGLK